MEVVANWMPEQLEAASWEYRVSHLKFILDNVIGGQEFVECPSTVGRGAMAMYTRGLGGEE
jgi:hypothetical protein